MEVAFIILHFHADRALLRQWVGEREGKYASETILEILDHQLKMEQTLAGSDADRTISINGGRTNVVETLIAAVDEVCQKESTIQSTVVH